MTSSQSLEMKLPLFVRILSIIIALIYGSVVYAQAFAPALAGIKNSVESKKSSLLDGMDAFGACMNKVRKESDSVFVFTVSCVKCHEIQSENLGNAVIEQCNQYVPNWCLESASGNGCRSGCEEKEPKCKASLSNNKNFGDSDRGITDSTKPKVAGAVDKKPKTTEGGADRGSSPVTQAQPSGNAGADQAKCDELQQKAVRCCNDPASCMTGSTMQQGPLPGQGLNEYCAQMRAAGAMGGSSNNTAGGVCFQAYQDCAKSCDSMSSGYSGQTAQLLKDKAQSCRGLQSRVAALGSQGLDSQMSGNSADMCNQASQAQPQNMDGLSGAPTGSGLDSAATQTAQNPNDPYGCAQNPNSSGCQAQAAYGKEVRGEASFGKTNDNQPKRGDFNINSMDVGPDTSGLGVTPAEPIDIKNGTIANNAGGGIPGGDGGGSGAKMDNRGGRSAGSPGYSTDVLQGLSSPSGYSAASMNTDVDGEGGHRGYGNGARDPASGTTGVDLKQFLPGGAKDPMRRGVGGYNSIHSAQINGKFVDIWNRISVRMREKCKLGQLIGCE